MTAMDCELEAADERKDAAGVLEQHDAFVCDLLGVVAAAEGIDDLACMGGLSMTPVANMLRRTRWTMSSRRDMGTWSGFARLA